MADYSTIARAAAVLAVLGLGGCVGAVTEGANIARDKAVVSNNMAAAQRGDAEAQFKVGSALCCSLNEGQGFYNTPQSVSWLCKAAAQNHGPAAQKLGEIYSGDTISGARVMRRVAQLAAGSTTNPAVAYVWMDKAEALGVAAARKPAEDLWASLTPAQRSDAEAMVTGKKATPCEWRDVTGSR